MKIMTHKDKETLIVQLCQSITTLKEELDGMLSVNDNANRRIAELEKQVESTYKKGYDDGHSKGFTEGYHEKEQELT